MNYEIQVCGRYELDDVLNSDFTHMISVQDTAADAEGLKPQFIRDENYLLLRFSDTQRKDEADCPNQEQLSILMNWARELPSTDVHKILVHCDGGISRSPAIAYIFLAVVFPEIEPARHLQNVVSNCQVDYAWPNPLVVSLADQIIGQSSDLSSVLSDWQDNQPTYLD